MFVKPITILTKTYNEMDLLTRQVEQIVAESGVKNGMVTVLTKHTTTGVTVNESLECLESDIEVFLSRMAPEDFPYSHARMLKDYGSTAGNPTGHLKAYITGNHCHFPIIDGEMVRGGAQDIYFCEFDGPAKRTVLVIVEGE
ncbi:secondary thiamine-phosphate synthase enzyme YjbQ [Ruthenibacterium sp. CLA-JM-H11]|uniref:Secondary thiamine-phosphate synthase enzyme YjbQ n=1 Tax=Ruthenibacterium intestinale TaxID=3133163 RepID=A0ABV1GD22_9FIRM